jgi:parallel beta-helix repeat protein
VLVTETGAGWNEFIDLDIHDNGATDHDHGLYISTSNNLVEKSTVHHNAGYGVHIYNGYAGQRADSNIVRQNQVYDNNQSAGYGAGILLSSGDSNIAYNNLIWGSSHYVGLQIGFSASNPMAYNNTIYNNHYGVDIGSSSSNAVMQNNIVYSSSASNYANRGVGTVADHNLIGTNPSFANAAAADFRLQVGSPAIDAGVTVSSVTTDFSGALRPQGGGYDLGAFELVP